MNLPKEFEKRMEELLGAEYSAFREAFCDNDEAAKGIRLSAFRAEDAGEGVAAMKAKFEEEMKML